VWLPGNVTQWLDPVLFPVQENAVLGRPMAGDGTSWTWSTPTTGPGPTRWRENFSPALRVKSAALFVVGTGGVKSYVNATPAPQLCIEDRDFGGSGCRWSCDDVDPNDGRLSYDLRAPHKCRNASGTEEVPTVNPTAAPLNLALFAQASPLAWRVSNVPSPQLWIEFTLDHTLPAFGLTGAPPLIDMGGARVGEGLRGAFVVHNSGQHPTRITAVAMAPPGGGSPHSADFVPQLPVAPQPVPLPVEVVSVASKETTIRIRPDAERELLHRLHRDSVLARVAPRGQGFSETIDGHVVTERDGLLTRDAVNARFIHDVAKQPAVRVTYAFRTPPFVVQPGESFEVSVRGTPSATGDRVAEVRVTGESVLDPTRRAEVRVLVKLFGMQGPLLSVQPGTANVYVDQGAGHARQRTLLIQNAGDVAGVLGAPLLRGRGGAALPANSPFSLEDPYASWGSLGATEFREVRVRFVSACGASPGYREDDAEVRWSTADGPLVVPVHGTTYCAP
jgi:hypothetical protein